MKQCISILKTGKNAGQKCKNKVYNKDSLYCGIHSTVNATVNTTGNNTNNTNNNNYNNYNICDDENTILCKEVCEKLYKSRAYKNKNYNSNEKQLTYKILYELYSENILNKNNISKLCYENIDIYDMFYNGSVSPYVLSENILTYCKCEKLEEYMLKAGYLTKPINLVDKILYYMMEYCKNNNILYLDTKDQERLLVNINDKFVDCENINIMGFFKKVKDMIILTKFFELEQNCITYINNSIENNKNDIDYNYHINYDNDNKTDILSEEQLKSINTIINQSKISILTGNPGTGKTFTLLYLIKYYMSKNFKVAVIALSGASVANIIKNIEDDKDLSNNKSDLFCGTIARFLKHINTQGTGVDDIIIYNCIIIDESSLLGYEVFYSIFKYLMSVNNIKLILTGDSNQLPPIGLGQLFKDIIVKYPSIVSKLSKNYRQKESLLKRSILAISENTFDKHKCFNEIDCKFIDSDDANILSNLLKEIRFLNIDRDNINVLCSQNNKSCGVTNINIELQKYYKTTEDILLHKAYDYVIYNNDKLLRIENSYEIDPANDQYNGDLYKIFKNDDYVPRKKCPIFKTMRYRDNQYFDICHRDNMKEFNLGYCINIHKSQGSQYEVVFILIPYEHSFMWKKFGKALLYTAISRAKTKCIIIGNRNLMNSSYNINYNIITGLNM